MSFTMADGGGSSPGDQMSDEPKDGPAPEAMDLGAVRELLGNAREALASLGLDNAKLADHVAIGLVAASVVYQNWGSIRRIAASLTPDGDGVDE
jgi:hypothetical protein